MASFSIEEFIGNGVLKELLPKLLDEGWDDVPTLKVMDSDDMNSIKMTQRQKPLSEQNFYRLITPIRSVSSKHSL
ncbi:hypothetical protein L195_g037251 [Trifolium pratense]|uniref:Uncharacterized protein n=1 Tax=Trifolium pratense TaxID=57577 RepID=A0A2K3LRR5_TRIPR|nr:hypothetical protein L195_g037251 [Trifolium pratense]